MAGNWAIAWKIFWKSNLTASNEPPGLKSTHTTWLHYATINTRRPVSFTPPSSDALLFWLPRVRGVSVPWLRFSPAVLISTWTTRKPVLLLLCEQDRNVVESLWLALAPSWPPGSQDGESDVAEGRGQQRYGDEEEPPAAVPRCQGKQCKPGALEGRVFDPPNSQMHFQTWKCMKLNFHGSRVLKPGNVKEELQLLGAWKEAERKTLFDMLECISLRYTISIIKFTRNNIYIHHISLINVSSGNQKKCFCPYGAFTPSDLPHSQSAWPFSTQKKS